MKTKMFYIKGKKMIAIVTFILILTIAVSFVALPAATAQEPSTKKTFAYIGAVPNPVGRGQEVLLHVGITDYLQTAEDGWEGLTVTVERPDGKKETIEDIRTDSTGGTGVTYVPDVVGTYYLQTHFPAQWYNYTTFIWWTGQWITRNVFYEASSSEILELIVQEERIEYYPAFELPTEYWTRPIDAQIREWSSVSGSWLTTPANLFAPYNDGPESAHILWAKPLTIGGLAGGELGPQGFGCGDAYEGKWTGSTGPYFWLSSAIILAGRLYYIHDAARAWGAPKAYTSVVYHCVDLHTGEELWAKTFLDNRTIAFGQLFYWDSYNYHGVYAYLWVTVGTTWYAFDAYTGDLLYTIKNVPSGTTLRGTDGDIYRLNVNLAKGWMAMWKASALISVEGSWGSEAHGNTFDAKAIDPKTGNLTTAAKRAWIWNVTIPTGLPGSVQVAELGDRVIGASVTTKEVKLWGLSLKPEEEGTLMFNNTWKAPDYWAEGEVTVTGFGGGWTAWSLEDKVGVLWVKETTEHYGFSLETGKYMWGPTKPQYYLDALEDTFVESRAIAYGKLYSASVSGVVYCYNVTTGKLLWTYEAYDPYQEILWANNWWAKPLFITDGKIYVGHYEHSSIDPKPRGAPFFCLNATTGDVIWRADGLFRQTRWGGRAIIGDSIIATMDTYDQRVYAIGKGPSATTVSIQNDVIAYKSSILIKGTVTDESPGTKEYSVRARFPNGVPAIADEDMGDWMLHVYKQFPRPADLTGVPVTLDAIDPNGTWIHIDTVTSDSSGLFSYMWTPPDEGVYKIIATFIGTKSYWASYAQTALGVGPEPTPYPAYPEAEEAADYTPMFLGIIAAVVVVAILVVYAIVSIRKQRK